MATIHESGQNRWTRRCVIFGVAALMSLAGVNAAFAQSVSSGTIEGTVKDESNAVLPGVTVTVTSPALQVGQLVQVSDAAGSYKFVDLPAGTYRLKAELTGFSAAIREDLRLTVGFNARIDLTLKLGAVEESVTVSGQSPVVDVSTTTASVAFTKEVLDSIPRGRDLQNVFAMAPGRHAGGRRCRRQHDGAAPEPVQLRRAVAAEAPGRRHEHHDGRRPEHRDLFQRQHARRGADQDVGQRCRGVGAGHFDGRDHEVGRQRLSRHVPGLHGNAETPGRQPERCPAGAGAHRHVAAEEFLRSVRGSRRPDHPRQVLVLRRVRAAGQERRSARVRVELRAPTAST